MTQPNLIPFLPESAPFTAEQRAYLNGFLAGLYSRVPAAGTAAVLAPAAKPIEPLAILFGSQTGNCEKLAKSAAKELGRNGYAPTIHDLASYPAAQISTEKNLLVITSTYGDGEPPDNAKAFWEFLRREDATKFNGLKFSLCALGDSNYPKFCQFGRELDARLELLGAVRVHPRSDCDADYEESFSKWLSALAPAFGKSAPASFVAVSSSSEARQKESSRYSKQNPYPARLLANRRLNGAGSEKDVRHFEISLEGSGLDYEAGDALAVLPQNDPVLVEEILAALGAAGDEAVPVSENRSVPFRSALTSEYEITRIPKAMLETFAASTGDDCLKRVTSPTANGELTKFLWGREIIDLLLAHPEVDLSPTVFTGFLRKLRPRLYSISSSPKAHPGEVHLTVGTVRYESLGRRRHGVCSTFLADRVDAGTPVPVFVHHNHAFRLPAPDRSLIMIGPGTGIAPFRAFLEERRATGATGRNWLFFGDQKSATDYLYREEIESFRTDGLLTRLDLAWSRDQAEKIYVQDRMLENAAELFSWIEAGASICVCGDAAKMAKDVDATLHRIIESAGSMSPEKAAEYVKSLKTEKRYQRDVY